MMISRIATTMVLALATAGCAFSPGQHMDSRDFTRDGSTADGHYRLVAITGKEIAMDAAAAKAAAVPRELLDFRPEAYRIGVGDSLYITVWDHPELTSPAGPQQQTSANGRVVRPDGTLFYPYVGVFHAAGLTVEELRSALARKLTKYVEKPQVDVNVIAYGEQRVTLRGAFMKTDPLPMTVVPMTLAQVIGAATINIDKADLTDLVLTRDGRDYHLDIDALGRAPHGLDDIWIKAGDRIFLPYNDGMEAYVVGEVVHPMAVPFKTGTLNLTQAIGRAGGLNPATSKGQAIYVIRGVENMENEPATIYQLDARSPSAFALGAHFRIRANDVVFVGPAEVTRWNRLLVQLLPISTIIQNAALANRDFAN